MTDYHSGYLTLDTAEGYAECEARFEIGATWSRRSMRGFRSVLHVSDIVLDGWTFDGRQQSRATAVALIGEAEVERQEDLALQKWRETAEQDDADSYGDYVFETRRDDYMHAAE